MFCSHVRYVCLYVCMYACMHVCTKSFLKTTTNSSCVCTHLANKADSDSDSDSDAAWITNSEILQRREFNSLILIIRYVIGRCIKSDLSTHCRLINIHISH